MLSPIFWGACGVEIWSYYVLKFSKCDLIFVHSAVNVCSHRCERLFIAL